MDDTKDLIAAFRGGHPAKCDFCGQDTQPENLEPEEAGAWVCRECIARWDAQDKHDEKTREAGAQAERTRLLKVVESVIDEALAGPLTHPTNVLLNARLKIRRLAEGE